MPKKKLRKIMPDEEKGEMMHKKGSKHSMHMQMMEEEGEGYNAATKKQLMQMFMKNKKKK